MANLSANLRLASFGKAKVAESMYRKGCSFIGAALLLRRQGGHEYMALHLLCQGVEIILKSLLLHRNYNKYKPQIKEKIGHDLEKAVDAVVAEFGRRNLSRELRLEIKTLNELYKSHLLRYGSGYDLMVDPTTIPSDRVLTKICRVIKMVDRYISW